MKFIFIYRNLDKKITKTIIIFNNYFNGHVKYRNTLNEFKISLFNFILNIKKKKKKFVENLLYII